MKMLGGTHHSDGDYSNNDFMNLATLCYGCHRGKGIGADVVVEFNEEVASIVMERCAEWPLILQREQGDGLT